MSDQQRYRTDIGGSSAERQQRVNDVMRVKNVAATGLQYWWMKKILATVDQYIEQENRVLESLQKRDRSIRKLENIELYYAIDEADAMAELEEKLARAEEAKRRKEDAITGQFKAKAERSIFEREAKASAKLDEFKMRQAKRDDTYAEEQHRARMKEIQPPQEKTPIEIAVELADLWEKGQNDLRSKGIRENDPQWQACKEYCENIMQHLSN